MATGSISRCARCGALLESAGRFCPTCGVDLSRSPAIPASDDVRHRGYVVPALVIALVLVIAAGSGLVFLAVRKADPVAQRSFSTAVVVARPPEAPAPASQAPAVPPSSPAHETTSAPARSFADLYREAQSGVVRISAVTCDGGGVGTGFLIDATHVLTAAHVVEGAAALQLEVGEGGASGTTSGVVVGIDREADLALIAAKVPLKTHVFSLATSDPAVGVSVAAIGFPEAEPMTLTVGTVSGLNRTIVINGSDRRGLIQTDTAINPGNSGGPMLTLDGGVVGVVDAKNVEAEGIGYAVSASTARARLDRWRGLTTSVITPACAAPLAPPGQRAVNPKSPGGTSADPEIDAFFGAYFSAINAGRYAQVWSLLEPHLAGPSPDTLGASLSSTYDVDVVVQSVSRRANGEVLAHIGFTSFQAPDKGPDGDTCDRWDLDYLLRPQGPSWRISAVSGHAGGRTHVSC